LNDPLQNLIFLEIQIDSSAKFTINPIGECFKIILYGPIYVKNMPCVGDQLGFRIQKKT
jgi:hypothetical protein